MQMSGLAGLVNFDVLIYVPMTGWSLTNPFFDGIKYTAPVM